MTRLTNIETTRVDYVKRGAVRDVLHPDQPQRLLLWKAEDEMSSDTRHDLPDSAFADPENRKYPHHFRDGSLDHAHLANALSPSAQNPNDPNASKIKAHLQRHANALGMGDEGDDAKKAESILHKIHKAVGDFLKADGNGNASGMDSAAMQAIRGALDTIAPHIDDLPQDVQDAFDELAEAADYSPQKSPEETPNETPSSPTAAAEPTRQKEGDDRMAEVGEAEIMRHIQDLADDIFQQHQVAKQQHPAFAGFTKEQAFVRALQTSEGRQWYARYRALDLPEGLTKADAESRQDALDSVEQMATRLQDREPSLSDPEAVRKALETPEGRQTYRNYVRHDHVSSADARESVRKQQEALSRAESAAAEIRKAEPSLTREQAMMKALERDPGLYSAYVQGE
jgi:hypothetical protein